MAKIESYKKFFGFKTIEDIHKNLVDSLLPTNRTYDFFVNWEKVRSNIEKYKVEIGILGSLSNTKNFEQDLRKILTEYPKVVKVIPLLIAVRDEKFDVLENLASARVYSFDFRKEITKDDIEKIIYFVKESGIEDLFKTIRVLHDYLLGVEVGLDTNARKNRSGTFMENVIEGELKHIKTKVDNFEIFPKGRFNKLEEYGVNVPTELQYRTPDFAIKKSKKLISIEVNFYSGQGSKPQEIVDAYINRQNELRKNGWDFIWITDGHGWHQGQNQIKKAVEQMDYVMNISFVKRGFLQSVVQDL
jgi:type II restriction enzyme